VTAVIVPSSLRPRGPHDVLRWSALATVRRSAGFKATVPVDGMSAEDVYNERYVVWHLYKGGPLPLTENVTLARSDLIKFGN